MQIAMKTIDDETINDLAVNWYFLSLQSRNQEVMVPDDIFNELIETGLEVKKHLKDHKFTQQQPMNVVVDGDTYFDIWLDEEDQIQASGLYDDEE